MVLPEVGGAQSIHFVRSNIQMEQHTPPFMWACLKQKAWVKKDSWQPSSVNLAYVKLASY